jgi:hypothetical protein
MTQTKIYNRVYNFLRGASKYADLRHLVTLGWIVAALLGCGSVNQAQWGVYVQGRAPSSQFRIDSDHLGTLALHGFPSERITLL